MRINVHRPSRNLALAAVLAVGLVAAPLPAHAVNRDMVELQNDVQNLKDAVAHLQQSNDERMGVLKDLVQQSADAVNKMSLAVDALQKQMRTQADATGAKVDQVSGQVGALNDSVDEIKARMNRLEKALQDLQGQQQSINAALQNMSPASGGAGAGTSLGNTPSTLGPATLPPTSPTDQPGTGPLTTQPTKGRNGKPSAGIPLAAVANPGGPTAPTPSANPAAPPASDLYKTALSDFMAAKYPLSTSEFSEIIRLYPDDPLAGNAFYYLGEIDYRASKYANSVRNYDHVLEQFPDNPKVPVSHLHKGMALFALKENEAGARELRALIARFPSSPEATQARSKLNGMGIAINPRR